MRDGQICDGNPHTAGFVGTGHRGGTVTGQRMSSVGQGITTLGRQMRGDVGHGPSRVGHRVITLGQRIVMLGQRVM